MAAVESATPDASFHLNRKYDRLALDVWAGRDLAGILGCGSSQVKNRAGAFESLFEQQRIWCNRIPSGATPMSTWDKWKTRPQNVFWRKALFQIHLWSGIGLGLYVALMSLSGSALVFRRELSRTLAREPRVAIGPGARMTEDELRQAARRAHPNFEVTRVSLRKSPDQAAEISLARPGETLLRLFNPYTGADLGDSIRLGFRSVLWLADLHDTLLLSQTGRQVNAVGGVLSLLLGMTGAVVWWPGSDSWRRSLNFRWKTNPKGFNWTLHSALGFWSFVFFFMWSFSGIYLSIPAAFNKVVDFLEPGNGPAKGPRLGDTILYWLAQLHFGRFAGIPVKIIWTVIGLAPTVLFVTGAAMWWKRILKPWMKRSAIESPLERANGLNRSKD